MKRLNTYITEKFRVSGDMAFKDELTPNDTEELINIINYRVESLKTDKTNKKKCLDLTDINVSKIKNLGWLFVNCPHVKIIDIRGWDTRDVTNMEYMFFNCENLVEIKMDDTFNTDECITMERMFSNCENLKTIDISNWRVDNAQNMSNMFYGCKKINNLDLSRWHIQGVNNMYKMFAQCLKLDNIKLFKKPASNTTIKNMFRNCPPEIIPDWYKA